MIRQSTWVLTAIVVLLLVWAPIPFGGTTTWAETSLEITAFLALALAMVSLERLSDLRQVVLPALAVLGVVLLGTVQSLPLPGAVVHLLAPELAKLENQATDLLGSRGSLRLTLAEPATISATVQWSAALACLLVGAVAGRRRVRRRWVGGTIIVTALAEVFFGARAANAGERTLWGVEVPITAARLRGTFFNPNHLALYLEIALALTFAWGWWVLRKSRNEVALDRRLPWIVPPTMVWLTLFAGLVFTQSRGGLVAALVGVLVQGALLATVGRKVAPAIVGVALGVAGIAGALSVGLQAGPARMLATLPMDVSFGARRQAWAATLELWRRSPLTGTGLGTLRDAFPLVQPASLGSTWYHSHNDPLEILATTGLVGATLLALGVTAVLWRLIVVLRDGRRSEDRAAGLAALGAVAAVGLHECFDFGLTIPANSCTLALLLGLAMAARLTNAPGERLPQPSGPRRTSPG